MNMGLRGARLQTNRLANLIVIYRVAQQKSLATKENVTHWRHPDELEEEWHINISLKQVCLLRKREEKVSQKVGPQCEYTLGQNSCAMSP